MQITALETFQVAPRWLFLKISTDEGIAGWGEPIVEGKADTVAACVAELSHLLVGKNPLAIEAHWQVLFRGNFYRGGPVLSSALAGIDQALWDIAGKVHGVPVHELLGGPVRDKVRMYRWVGGKSPDEIADAGRRAVSDGFDALKCAPHGQVTHLDKPAEIRRFVGMIEALREAVGDSVDIGIDFHGRFTLPQARRTLPLLEPLLPFFVEEPLPPEFSAQIGELTHATSIPIATGERLFSRWDFEPVLSAGISVAQPDLSHAGGISEVRRIAAAAETRNVAVAPHCPLGPIALAASLAIDFAIPNFLIQEQSLGIEYNSGNELLDYLVDPTVFAFTDGYVARPTAPGLGIEVDEQAVRRAAEHPHHWKSPLTFHADGSFAEW
jgi:galactonate dehydratase